MAEYSSRKVNECLSKSAVKACGAAFWMRHIWGRMYLGVSLQDIADMAGVLRGAITDHYPSKLDLMSVAIHHCVHRRYGRVHAAFESKKNLELRERPDILWKEFHDLLPITFALIVALPADKDFLARDATASTKPQDPD